MADEIRLIATPRNHAITARALRREGQTPGVLYGQGSEGETLQFEAAALDRVVRRAGMNELVTLDVQGETRVALVRETQRDPVSGEMLHVDFYRVIANQTLTSTVRIVQTGHSPAVEEGGTVNQLLEALDIECLPSDLPDDIMVDLALLTDMDSVVTVADLPIPPGVTVLTPADADVLRVMAPRLKEESEVVEEKTAIEPDAEPKRPRAGSR
jgi:large subunit ribosomal protein L25